MHDIAIYVGIEARFRSNGWLLQESATKTATESASQASPLRLFADKFLVPKLARNAGTV